MTLLLLENQSKNKADFVLSPCTTPAKVYNSKGIIRYLTKNRIVAKKIVHTIHSEDGM